MTHSPACRVAPPTDAATSRIADVLPGDAGFLFGNTSRLQSWTCTGQSPEAGLFAFAASSHSRDPRQSAAGRTPVIAGFEGPVEAHVSRKPIPVGVEAHGEPHSSRDASGLLPA